jgi:hypothetical protein
MDYNRNVDKYCATGYSHYNTVIGTVFSDEGSEPVDLDTAKIWCKIDNDDLDDVITALITAARRMCEQFSNIGFITRTVEAKINNANGGFDLPYGPVTNDPTAVDEYGNSIDLTMSLGQIESPYGRMVVTYEAGHSTLPEELTTALKAQLLFLEQNRGEGDVSLSPIARMILEPLRMVA